MERLRRSVFGAALVCASLFATSTAVASEDDWTDGLTTQQMSWVDATATFFSIPNDNAHKGILSEIVRSGELDTAFGPGWEVTWDATYTSAECDVLRDDIRDTNARCQGYQGDLNSCVGTLGQSGCSNQLAILNACLKDHRRKLEDYDNNCPPIGG
jgi:hypothetical protein